MEVSIYTCILSFLLLQVNKKPSLRECWWDIRFEGNGGVKSKETRIFNSKGKCHSPIFSPFVTHTMFVC